jgi:hypothetical protein
LPVKEEVPKASRKSTSGLGASPHATHSLCSHARLRLPADLPHKSRQFDMMLMVSAFGKAAIRLLLGMVVKERETQMLK